MVLPPLNPCVVLTFGEAVFGCFLCRCLRAVAAPAGQCTLKIIIVFLQTVLVHWVGSYFGLRELPRIVAPGERSSVQRFRRGNVVTLLFTQGPPHVWKAPALN